MLEALQARLREAQGSRYRRNLWRMAGANAAAQGLALLLAPWLTRLYGPEAFGAFGVLSAVVGVALAVATLRVEWLIPNPRSATQAAALLAIGMVALVVLCGIGALLATVLHLLGWPLGGEAGLWLAVPLLVAVLGLMQLLQAWHVRRAELGAAGAAAVGQSAGNLSIAIGVGHAAGPSAGVWGLVAGSIGGALVAAGLLMTRASGLARAWGRLSARRVVATWIRFRAQAAASVVAAVLNAASQAIVPLMLVRHYPVADVGIYALVQRVAFAPVAMLGAAVRQGFWAEAAALARTRPGSVRPLFVRSAQRLALLAVPVVLLALAGPLYMGPLFGADRWSAAGPVLAASAPLLVGQMVVSPLSHLEVHGRQGWQARWDGLRLVALAAVIETAGRSGWTLSATVLALSLVGAAMYLALWRLNLRALDLAAPRDRGGA